MPELLTAEPNVAKACGTCGVTKSLAAFPRHRQHKDGHASECKDCNAIRGRDWYRARQSRTNRLFSTYLAMKQRCHNRNHEHFDTYGGRGIHVCEEWRNSFDAFVAWAMQNGYQPNLQIDRIDNDKGYSPENCRFVTPIENARNKRKPSAPRRNNPTLTLDQVRQIKELLVAGISQREIGRRFGVTHGTVWAISAGRSWIDVN